MSEKDTMLEGIKAFGAMIDRQNIAGAVLGRTLATECGIPYSEAKEKHSPDEKPDSYNTKLEALDKVDRPVEVYYHYPTMNLVVVAADGQKVGIRSTDIGVFGIPKGDHADFVQKMKAKCG